MVPDGTVGKAFFLGQSTNSFGSGTYTLQSFDLQTFTPIDTLTIPAVVGTPTRLIRWGTNGLTFTTVLDTFGSTGEMATGGAVYLISGAFVTETAAQTAAQALPEGNVQRSWPVRTMRVRKDPQAAGQVQ